MPESVTTVVLDEEKVARVISNHAGIVVDINNSRVTANTPVTPELMFIQKMLASICSDIIRF